MKLIPLTGKGNEYLFNPEDSKVVWVSRYKKGFQRLQRSLKTENAFEARNRRDELFTSWFGVRQSLSAKVKPLCNDIWPEWIQTKQRKSSATKESISTSEKHLLPSIGNLYLDEVTEYWWENVFIPKKREHKADRKFFNDRKWLLSFLNYAKRQGHLNIIPNLENPDGDRAEGINLDDSEILALYSEASPDLTLQIDLGFKHFMRRSEVLLLPWSEIDFKKGEINLPKERTKIRKKRTVPLNNAVLTQLKARKATSKSAFVFPSPDDPKRSVSRLGNATAWNKAIARANKEKVKVNPDATFHDLRHSGLSRAFVATNRYVEICVMAGLSLSEAQKTYLHLTSDNTRFVADLVSL